MKKVIITDVDGVISMWSSMLPFFAQEKGIDLSEILKCQRTEEFIHTKDLFKCTPERARKLKHEYHNSNWIRYLTAYNDALDVLNSLNKDEYKVIAVTALDNTDTALENRSYNLNVLFPGVFSEIHLTDNDKSAAFRKIIGSEIENGNRIIAYVDDLAHHIDTFNEEYKMFYDMTGQPKTFFLARGKRDKMPSLNYYSSVYNVKDWYNIKEILL
jgi:uncharacterized 32.4 kDa protein in gp30-rIII intergenic region